MDVTGISLTSLLANLADSLGGVYTLVMASCYLLGTWSIWIAIRSMVTYAREPMKSDVSAMGPFVALFTAVALIGLPTMLDVLGGTLFGSARTTSPLAYTQLAAAGHGPLGPMVPLMQIIGLVSVIRGFLHIRAAGMASQYTSGKDANAGKRGLIFILSGVFLVHLQETLVLFSNLTGLNLGAGLF